MTDSNNSDFIIKEATPEDVPLILSFIKQLAEYEKLADQVVATERILRKNLFGEKKYAEVVIGYYKEEAAGFALYFYNFSTFLAKPGIYLEDIYVKPEFRGNGLGKILLSYIAKVAKERNCGRLEWWVLDWNKPAIKFYKNLGAQAMEDWTVYRVTGEELLKLSDMNIID